MKTLWLPCIALLVTACSQDEGRSDVDREDLATPQSVTTDSAAPDAGVELIRTRGAGTVMATDPETYFITLDHEAIPAIQMGAMRMPFDVAESVDLTPYAEGDAVIFDLEASEATGLLITRMCRPATDGADCLDG